MSPELEKFVLDKVETESTWKKLPLIDARKLDPKSPAATLQWAQVHDGNLDEVPDRLVPEAGCPECGSVWIDYSMVGFRVTPGLGQPSGLFHRESFMVHPVYYALESVRAVRLHCFEGHVVDFDGTKLWAVPRLPRWAQMAALAGFGALSYTMTMRLTSK